MLKKLESNYIQPQIYNKWTSIYIFHFISRTSNIQFPKHSVAAPIKVKTILNLASM